MAAALFQQGLQQFIGSQKKKPGDEPGLEDD